jgi:hypothetical protein
VSTFLELADPNEIVISCRVPFRSHEVCLACLHGDGRLELLTGPWVSLLGFKQAELDGRWLHSLLPGGRGAAETAVQRLLDPLEPDPVVMEVRTKDGSVRGLRIYRHFDFYEPSLYFACEPFEGGPPMSRTSSSVSFLNNP